jgi:hypothetical protein
MFPQIAEGPLSVCGGENATVKATKEAQNFDFNPLLSIPTSLC